MIERINVTKSFLPPIEEYEAYIKRIWASNYLTNQGPLLQEFEANVKEFLGVSDFHFVTNGTLALQVALRALNITEGEVITTPFSYVATTSAILWERCTPVFVDIEPDTLCIDADKIEAAITKDTKAILAVHVFGNPCDVDKIELLAKKHDIKVIYDGAHAFGVEYKGKSLLSYGDISTCSFHATKLFHTIEGGAIIAKDKKVSDKVELIKRFGHNGDEHHTLGTNAKASEFQAAMGLTNLPYLGEIIEDRKRLFDEYHKRLNGSVKIIQSSNKIKWNYAYLPVVFRSEEKALQAVEKLNAEDIYPRRYFHPSLNKLSYLNKTNKCPISEEISKKILCLPLYYGLKLETLETICGEINET